ncbi:MAG: PHP-associated domain-containing protein [Clostridia bacterium]
MTDGFYVQLHMHTAESSRCAKSSAQEMVRAAKRAGYALIVVTDHFMNANLNAPANATWPEKVDCLMRGYENAKREGDKIGLPVLFAWETNNGGPEILTYGLGREYLLAHPDAADWDEEVYARRVRAAGAFISHAHPFREAFYIPAFTPRPELYDAFEVYNYSHEAHRDWDYKAYRMAKHAGLLYTAGSDAHRVQAIGGGAMLLPGPVSDMPGLICALRTGTCKVYDHIPEPGA